MRKKFISVLILTVCCLAALGGGALAADTPKLYSDSACVIDASNGEILYQKYANRQERPASITKQMTALLVLEKAEAGELSLNDKVKVTNEALSTVDLASTRIGFEAGQKRRVKDLMSCMLVYSANDAANILAEYAGGSVSKFVDEMNEKAKEIGCTNTHFSNPNGLDPDDDSIHLTTAHDMALISYELSKYPTYYKIAGQTKYVLDTDKVISEGWTVATKVDMLDPNSEWYNPETLAGKTGWTSKAHHTMCTYQKRGKRQLVVVVMNSLEWTQKYRDTNALVDYCMNNFDEVSLRADDYRDAAETSLAQNGGDVALDADHLPELKVYLPGGMTADDVRYKVVSMDDDNVQLAVGVATGKWEAYRAATHVGGKKAILGTYNLPIKKSLAKQVAETVSGKGKDKKTDHGSLVIGSTKVNTTMLITIAAAVLVLLSLFFLIFRSMRNKKKKVAGKDEHQPLQVVIKTPEQYQDKIENKDEK